MGILCEIAPWGVDLNHPRDGVEDSRLGRCLGGRFVQNPSADRTRAGGGMERRSVQNQLMEGHISDLVGHGVGCARARPREGRASR